jgi:hypothetical protein
MFHEDQMTSAMALMAIGDFGVKADQKVVAEMICDIDDDALLSMAMLAIDSIDLMKAPKIYDELLQRENCVNLKNGRIIEERMEKLKLSRP